jgi:hypothetical protein
MSIALGEMYPGHGISEGEFDKDTCRAGGTRTTFLAYIDSSQHNQVEVEGRPGRDRDVRQRLKDASPTLRMRFPVLSGRHQRFVLAGVV